MEESNASNITLKIKIRIAVCFLRKINIDKTACFAFSQYLTFPWSLDSF